MVQYVGNEIYDRMHRYPTTTQSLDAAQRATDETAKAYRSLADALTKSQASMNNFWQGKGSENAQSGLTPYIQNVTDAAEKQDATSQALSKASVAFTETANKMTPLPPRPHGNGLFGSDWHFFGSDNDQEIADWDTASNANLDAYHMYGTAAGEYGNAIAANSTFPAMANPGAVPIPDSSSTSGTAAQQVSHSSGGISGVPNGSAGFSPGDSGFTPGQQFASPAFASSASTGAGSLNSRPTSTPPSQTTTPGGYQSGASRFPGSASQIGSPVGSGSSSDFGSTGFGPLGGGIIGGYGAGGAVSGGFGGGGASGGGAGGASSAGANSEKGLGAGNKAGSVVPGEIAARGGTVPSSAVGPKGAAGMGGMPMGGGMGRGQGQGDEQRTSSYLIAGDPDEVFGSDEKTAPPTIGE